MSIRLSDERCEEINQEVVNLFERYNINCVPISGFEIASKMGIKVMPYSSKAGEAKKLCLKESEDGFSIRRGSKWYIFYNDDKQFGRINNTMLHEIGHIVLDHTEDSELAEKEVKFFAKYALVPPVLVHKLKLTSPEKISETFDVSYEAAYYALVYYNKWLHYSGKYYKPYEEQLLALFSENTLSLV